MDLDVGLAVDVARAASELANGGPVVVGRDTRRSGPMLAAALQAGFHSVGIDTIDADVLPVGGVSALTVEMECTLGVMVSASHNAAPYNGIKFLDSSGTKLGDDREDLIEARLRRGPPWSAPTGARVGTRHPLENAVDLYLDTIRRRNDVSLDGLRLVADCAHGAAYRAAPTLLRSMGADLFVCAADPDGMNINEGCGATDPHGLAVIARAERRIGLGFDGDADRLIAVDEEGNLVNGDVILAILAKHLKEQGELAGDRVVTTVMSNLGFRRAMDEAGIEVVETQVGDRYVSAAMEREGAVLGGEQSGHIIMTDRSATGDGLLTALRLLEVVTHTGSSLSELSKEAMRHFPQALVNVSVRDMDLADADGLEVAISEAESELGTDGRVLVRASGTEPVVRVMVEAASEEQAEEVASRLADLVAGKLG